MYKIGVIGDRESVLGFVALGFAVYPVDDERQAGILLSRLVKTEESDFTVIFITEELAEKLKDELEKYKNLPLPAIIPIPGASGKTGYGMQAIRDAAERAVGIDILFKDK